MSFVDLDKVINLSSGSGNTSPISTTTDIGRFMYSITSVSTNSETVFYANKYDLGKSQYVFQTEVFRTGITAVWGYQNKILETDEAVYLPVHGSSFTARVVKVNKTTGALMGTTFGYAGSTILGMDIDEANNRFFVLVSGTPNELFTHSLSANGFITGPGHGIPGENNLRNVFYSKPSNTLVFWKYVGGVLGILRCSIAPFSFEASIVNNTFVSAPQILVHDNENTIIGCGNDSQNVTLVGSVSSLSLTKFPISGNPPVVSVAKYDGPLSSFYIANGALFGYSSQAPSPAIAGMGTTIASSTPFYVLGGRGYVVTNLGLQSFSILGLNNVITHYFLSTDSYLLSFS